VVPTSGSPDITVGSYTAQPGDVVVVEIKVGERVRNVAGAQVLLRFGEIGELTNEADVKYGVIPAGGFIGVNLTTPGEAIIGVVAIRGGDGPGTLLYVPIKLRSDLQPGTYPLKLVVAELNDPSGMALQGLWVSDGQVRVSEIGPRDIAVGSYTAAPGDVVVVEVKVSERVKGVAGAKLVLEFGQIGEVTSGSEVKYGVIPPGGRVSASLSEPGKAIVEVAGSSGGDGPGTLVYIPLKLRSDLKAGSYPLVLRVERLSNTAGSVLYGPGDGTPGEVKVVRRGDMNGDDRITTSDATIALRIAIGLERASEYQLRVGDLNGNGKIDVSDATKILRGAIGLERL
jgi:hypothetical protein